MQFGADAAVELLEQQRSEISVETCELWKRRTWTAREPLVKWLKHTELDGPFRWVDIEGGLRQRVWKRDWSNSVIVLMITSVPAMVSVKVFNYWIWAVAINSNLNISEETNSL